MKLAGPIAALCIVAIAACNPIYVNTDYDKDADFDAFRTFSWVERSAGANPLLEKRVRSWIEVELAAKGITFADQSPDFLVNFIGDAQEAVDIHTTGTGYGFTRSTRTQRYEDGTILIDLIDASDNQLVWRGMAELTLSENPTPDEINKRVHEAIKLIIQEYPPK